MENIETPTWRKCNSCKKNIAYGTKHYVCSVSTCNGQRTGYVFCSVSCFEVHLPAARHKDAAAIEHISPRSEPSRKIISAPGAATASQSNFGGSKTTIPRDVLIIASRLKEYIQARGDMNTSAGVMEVLSEQVRRVCDKAIDHARNEGRKTVLERDFKFQKE